jgi:hypothetical protein
LCSNLISSTVCPCCIHQANICSSSCCRSVGGQQNYVLNASTYYWVVQRNTSKGIYQLWNSTAIDEIVETNGSHGISRTMDRKSLVPVLSGVWSFKSARRTNTNTTELLFRFELKLNKLHFSLLDNILFGCRWDFGIKDCHLHLDQRKRLSLWKGEWAIK